jgi:uncharacterized SAM-binding protein YcdF (DUF218 family)
MGQSNKMDIEKTSDYIFLNDGEQKSDLAFVFGTHLCLRQSVEKAVELYNKGLIPKIVFTGGVNAVSKKIESKEMKNLALMLGVKEQDIITEDKSTNTMENVTFALPIIDKEIGLANIKKITVVVKDFHSRRAVMTLKKYLTEHIKILSAPYESDDHRYSKEVWHETEIGREKINEEIDKIRLYLEKGHLAELN